MTNKHTPGPWTMSTVTTSCGICHKIGPFPGNRPDAPPRHACLYADYPGSENPADIELMNNARLIAAAPDLLAALQSAMVALEQLVDIEAGSPAAFTVGKARAAIAKATGQALQELADIGQEINI